MPTRRWAVSSLVCTAISLAISPVVFGPLGVVAGMAAVWKGARWWGAAGVSAVGRGDDVGEVARAGARHQRVDGLGLRSLYPPMSGDQL